MEERKHIDRLYQEKFKDFEATPREMVWKNISARLEDKERKRTVVPIWYRIAGVAALVALLFNFATNLFKTSPETITQSASAQQQDSKFGEFSLISSNYTEKMLKSSTILQALIQNTEKLREAEQQKYSVEQLASQGAVAISQGIKEPGINKFSGAGYSFSDFNDLENYHTGVIAVSENKTNSNLKDLTQLAIEKDLAAETPVEKNLTTKKLRVTTTAAPLYSDNLGNGNAIDSRFANNESSGEISMSYGVNFAYQLSEKIRIRSGISKVDLSYNTRNIAFTAAVNPSTLAGIDYRGEIPKYRIENNAARPFSNINASAEFNRSSLASPVTGYLNQRLGFIEVPLEIEYVIIDKKVGLNIIGGGSTLFLDENMISLNSANFSTDIGQGNNLNAVSFSTNIGIGVDYKISPKFQLNLEPIFKYQINTFNTSSNLNPYYFGVYSGFSFKF
jgi:hypothetical protein